MLCVAIYIVDLSLKFRFLSFRILLKTFAIKVADEERELLGKIELSLRGNRDLRIYIKNSEGYNGISCLQHDCNFNCMSICIAGDWADHSQDLGKLGGI